MEERERVGERGVCLSPRRIRRFQYVGHLGGRAVDTLNATESGMVWPTLFNGHVQAVAYCFNAYVNSVGHLILVRGICAKLSQTNPPCSVQESEGGLEIADRGRDHGAHEEQRAELPSECAW
jgi:hypothetical protein